MHKCAYMSTLRIKTGSLNLFRCQHADGLRDILVRLDASATVADMDLPGFRLHPLKGEMKGFWAVSVRANWRVIFLFADGDAFGIDYLDDY
jgi:proteic killer suppression protein